MQHRWSGGDFFEVNPKGYRLALGQPDPEAFMAMLKKVGAQERNPRDLAVNLAAISRPERAS